MGTERILIVDDEKNIVASLKEILTDEGYEVSVAEDGLGALEMIQSDPPDLVLLDIWLPGMDGIEVLRTVKTYHPEIEILIMSGHGTIDTAVKATKLGAYDFIEKPFSLDQLTLSVENVLKQKKTRQNYNGIDLYQKGEFPLCFELLVEVKKATLQASRDNRPVLLLGERGTGKEFIAHAIHRGSPHGGRPFIKVNCAVRKPRDILSKLFPREKTPRTEHAKPIIYLTNIEALDKSLQDRLAGALEKGIAPDFLPARLIVSSSRNLHELARSSQFSQKLLDRFRDRTVKIPPLREYVSSIPVMVKDYFQICAKRGKFPVPEIDADALTALCEYNWPKNINELRSVLDKLLITGSSRRKILFQDLPPGIQKPQGESSTREFETSESYNDVELFWEKGYIIHHLRKNDWDLGKTCLALKVDPGPFKEKLRRHSIDLPESRESQGGSHPALQRTLKRSVVLCGSGLHSGINTGLILQPLPPGNGIIFGDISTGQTIPARLENVQSTEYSTCLKKGLASVATIEHIMAVLHMYRITNLLIKIGDEAPVMDGSAKDFCALIEDGEFEEQDELYEEIVIDRTYSFGSPDQGGPFITVEPAERFTVSYHMEYPEPIGIEDYTFVFDGAESFKKEIAPARTFGFLKDVTQLTKMGFATGGKLDNFILLGDKKVLNTQLRFQDEFVRHKILDILGDFYLLGKPLLGHIKAHKSGHTQNIGLLKKIRNRMASVA
ncbi:MAG: UDP-3-O-acyl-N-acetylglucosamine deacetylase [Nitrospinaceae bacterium]